MNTLVIRPAGRRDVETLIDFQKRLALETENVNLDAETVRKGMFAMFDDPSKGRYFTASSGDQIVGCFMVTYEWSDWRNGVVYWLQSVYVMEDFRKHGVFRKMFSYLRDFVANDPGIAGLRLYVDKTNVRAQNVYAAMGMDGDHYAVFELMKS